MSKPSSLKAECFNCSYLDARLSKEHCYLCAVPGSCPGLDMTEEEKEYLFYIAAIVMNYHREFDDV